MNPESHSEKQEPLSILARNRNLIKGFFISFLILALLIPTYFIGNIIDERKQRNEDVKKEIAITIFINFFLICLFSSFPWS